MSGTVYLLAHRLLWGSWTVYATGDHFEQTGEFSVVGVQPDYVGRSLRLVALAQRPGLRAGSLAAGLAACCACAGRVDRLAGTSSAGHIRAAIVAPLVAGWAVATWPALTMHGFWWPGRQVVVVLPLAALAVLWWIGRVVPRLQPVALVLGALGVVHLAALLIDGWAGEITWVVSFETVDDPLYQLLRPFFPDYRSQGPGFWPLHLAWVAVVLRPPRCSAHARCGGPSMLNTLPTKGSLVS